MVSVNYVGGGSIIFAVSRYMKRPIIPNFLSFLKDNLKNLQNILTSSPVCRTNQRLEAKNNAIWRVRIIYPLIAQVPKTDFP